MTDCCAGLGDECRGGPLICCDAGSGFSTLKSGRTAVPADFDPAVLLKPVLRR